ncbi:MAG: hypothetical protein HC866_11610 [Leptolyngbyaceae cyanobacterium RU_5_1]|nr:hypothetical protein [Leptolyngbyaceae cyanobacterium RU_5_1]
MFTLISLIGMINHEMWRDELQAWLIAVNSSSIPGLFQTLKYEGHPALWHICLYVISRFTHNPIAMQLFHFSISVGSIYVFTRFSTFSKSHKVLFVFGYFPFFEYNLISRSYSLGILFIFLFCSLFPNRYRNYLILSVLLALLANTSIFGWIISICLAMTLILERIINRNANKLNSFEQGKLALSLSIFMTSVMIAFVQMLPPSDAQFHGNKGQQALQQSSSALLISVKHLSSTLLTVWKSYIPIPKLFEHDFWNTNILTAEAIPLSALALILSITLLFLSVILFIRKPIILFLYLSGTFSILLFIHEVYLGYLRHYGHLFMLFLVCVWLSSYYKQSNILIEKMRVLESIKSFVAYISSRKIQYFTGILYIHAFAGIFAFSMDLIHPFSASQEVASFIRNQQLDKMLIVGSSDTAVSPLAAWLDREIYYPDIRRSASFVPWNDRQPVDSQGVLNQVSQLTTQNNTDVLLVLNYQLNLKKSDLTITELSRFDQSIVSSERYYLYLAQKNR